MNPISAQIVAERSRGVCERCARNHATQLHHRRPRGMGGRKSVEKDSPANLLHLCQPCHADIESNRLVAIKHGWLLSTQGVEQPHEVPVEMLDGWWLLDATGHRRQVEVMA